MGAPTDPPHTMPAEGRRAVAVALVLALLVAGAVAGVLAIGGKGSNGRPRTPPSSPPPSVSLQSVPAATKPASRISGWITASASGIKDDSGQAVRLLGVAEGRMNQCKPLVPTDNEGAVLERLGFNSVRLAISWAATEPSAPTQAADGSWQHHWDDQYLAKVDQAVSAFRAHGIAVILDVHQVRLSSVFGGSRCTNVSLPAWVFAGQRSQGQAVCGFFTDTAAPQAMIRPYDALSALWRLYAQRYAKDSTVVAADVYNEPYVPDGCPNVQRENLARFYGAVGTAIRQVNPKITLILEDAAYEAYQRAGLQLSSLPPLTNLIYSWHFYPTSWKEGMPGLAAHVARARALKAPLWLGEFDAFGGANNNGRRQNANWQSDLDAMMNYCRSNDVSWALWEFRGRGSSLVDRVTGNPKQPLIQHLQAGL